MRPVYAIFRVNGQVVGQTRGQTDRYITKLARAYATEHMGETVTIEYPTLRIVRGGSRISASTFNRRG